MTVHTILGAGGVIADTLASELLAHQLPVRLVSRKPAAREGAATLAADLTDPVQTLRAINPLLLLFAIINLIVTVTINPWRSDRIPERFPNLKIVFIEGGFGWIPSATWRMDQHFERFRSEVPHLKRRPSEFVKEHFWFTTQPIDEPDEARHLRSLIEWVGVDRLLFSSDYPHWDFDDPRYAFKTPLTDAERRKIFNSNARAIYKF